jgi:hypothetical protein
MSKYTSPLENIRIASPCPANWDEMYGNDRMRFCSECKLNVYNLSGMSREEAENLLMNAEGRLCIRFFKRADGTVITQNCPVGWARVKARAKVFVTAAFSLMMTLFGGLFVVSLFARQSRQEVGKLVVSPTPTPTPNIEVLTGAVAPNTKPATMGDVDGEYLKRELGMVANTRRNTKL